MNKLLHYIIVSFGFLVLSFFFVSTTSAQEIGQETYYEAIIQKVILGDEANASYAQVEIVTGDSIGHIVTAEFATSDAVQSSFKVGEKVVISRVQIEENSFQFFVVDHVRRQALFLLFVIFLLTVLVVSKVWGLRSLLGLLVSFIVIYAYLLPLLLKGYDPILTSVTAATVIIIVTFYLSHGVNKKTHVALISTFVTLVLTALLAEGFSNLANLTGYASEEAVFLQGISSGGINIRGLLLSGIIIGTLGILDDITISQAAVVDALRKANPKYSPVNLFTEAMKVGNDHIASLVNTLVLVYAGASLPLLLLFMNSQQTFAQVINYELIAEEIVRTLVGSIGLVLAVPITSLLAANAPSIQKTIRNSIK